MQIKAVIFDRDGVLLDSESLNVSSAVEAFKELGIDIDEEDKKKIVGRHPGDYHKDFLGKYKFSYDKYKKLQADLYYAKFETTKLFEETISLVRELKVKYKLALTTSGSRITTTVLLKRLKMENTFDVVITAEDCKTRKPAPDPYLITAKQLNLKPEECLVIEDTQVGVESANAAGCVCIAFPNELTKHQDFSKADIIVNSAEQIKNFLCNNKSRNI